MGAAVDSGEAPALAALLAEKGHNLSFGMLEIGALPIEGDVEPFHRVLDLFPASRLAALEIDAVLCAKLNEGARRGMHFYPCALGRTEEKRALYETAHSMCTSLYAPDERYADVFNLLDVMRLRRKSEIETTSLDTFIARYEIGALDFIKIDVQGAELDVLQGGASALADVVLLVCEVEFVPMYKNQPLFADVDTYLRSCGFMLHKFLGMAGRVMKPLAVHGTGRYPVQMMWSDALYTRDLFEVAALSADRMLKLAVLLDLYDSKDVALHVLRHYDAKTGGALADAYLTSITASRDWTQKQPGVT